MPSIRGVDVNAPLMGGGSGVVAGLVIHENYPVFVNSCASGVGSPAVLTIYLVEGQSADEALSCCLNRCLNNRRPAENFEKMGPTT